MTENKCAQMDISEYIGLICPHRISKQCIVKQKLKYFVYENSKEAGANIDQWEYWGGDGQKWKLEKL